eukprot:Clim_evm5s227 gene=Clim_evmTU5s227
MPTAWQANIAKHREAARQHDHKICIGPNINNNHVHLPRGRGLYVNSEYNQVPVMTAVCERATTHGEAWADVDHRSALSATDLAYFARQETERRMAEKLRKKREYRRNMKQRMRAIAEERQQASLMMSYQAISQERKVIKSASSVFGRNVSAQSDTSMAQLSTRGGVTARGALNTNLPLVRTEYGQGSAVSWSRSSSRAFQHRLSSASTPLPTSVTDVQLDGSATNSLNISLVDVRDRVATYSSKARHMLADVSNHETQPRTMLKNTTPDVLRSGRLLPTTGEGSTDPRFQRHQGAAPTMNDSMTEDLSLVVDERDEIEREVRAYERLQRLRKQILPTYVDPCEKYPHYAAEWEQHKAKLVELQRQTLIDTERQQVRNKLPMDCVVAESEKRRQRELKARAEEVRLREDEEIARALRAR